MTERRVAGSWPSVAVVVPNHSRIDELREALASIEVQDYPGRVHAYLVYWPRPEVEPLLAELGDSVTAIASTDEEGRNSLAHKRNLAIAASTEDFVAFLDDDDVWHPDKLRLQVKAMRSDPDLVAVGTGVVNFAEGTPGWEGRPSGGVSGLGWYERHLGHCLCTSSLLMPGDIVRDLLMDERPHWLGVSDYHLKLRLGLEGGLARVDGGLVGYRVGHGAMFAQDVRHNLALALSVLAAAGEAGVGGLARRLVAVQVLWASVWSQVGIGQITERADERLVEALDGRLFGPLDRIVRVLLLGWWHTTVGWTGPRRLLGRVRRLRR